MHRAAAIPLRLLGLRRPRPTTRLGRAFRRAERGLYCLLLAYAALQAYPQALFAHSITAGGITAYARHPLPPGAGARLAEARALVDRSELAAPGRRERVFVCDSPWLFGLFAPLHSRAFAVSIPVTGHIFLAAADFDADRATSPARGRASRPLAGTIAHEVAHGLIRRRLGLVRAARLPAWIAEGYPEYVAGSGTMPEAEGRRLLAAGAELDSSAFLYHKYGRMVAHLVDDRRLTFDQIVARAGDGAAVEAETRAALRNAR